MHDFLIVGGGINGLLVARELASTGADIILIDKGVTGNESSWAGGGIVSPLYPWHYSAAVTELASWSQAKYPNLIDELIDATGIDPQYSVTGLLMLAAQDEQQALSWARKFNRRMELVDATFIYEKAPRLAKGYESALWMSDVANVRNPRLCKALREFLLRQSNVRLVERMELLDISTNESRLTGIEIKHPASSETENISARNYIFCAGAWTFQLMQKVGVEINVYPVKGQMLLYQQQESALTTILLKNGYYLIPRKDGLMLAGSTLEYSEFDKSITAPAREELGSAVRQLLPELADQEPVKQWAGLRPGSDRGLPFIGKVAPFENLFVNAGQFRNGLLLAPASARLMSDIILRNEPIVTPEPFDPRISVGSNQVNT